MSQPSILHSIKWNYVGALFKGGSQLAVLGVMARLLKPEEFGLMALALVAIKFGSYFSDFGLAAAIQQKKEINDNDIQASFWFSLLAGFGFFLATGFLGNTLAIFFEEPKLEPVIELIAFSFIIIGASATSMGLIKRKMQFKLLSITETTVYLISNGIIGIVLAYQGYGVYSLAIAYLSQLFLTFLVTYAVTRHTLRPTFNFKDYKHILKFGGGYTIASFMTFLTSQIDHLLIGKFFPSATLGLWNRSRNIIFMPTYSLLVSITGVLLPAYSKNQNDIERFQELYLNSLIVSGFILIPIGGGMFAAAPELVAVLLGSDWQTAIPLVQLSALFVPAEMLASVAATACSALGLFSMQIRLQAYLSFVLVPTMLFFANDKNLYGILIVLAAYYWIRFFCYIIYLGKKLKIQFYTYSSILASQLVASLWIGEIIYLAARFIPETNPFKLLPIEIILGALGLILYFLFGPAKVGRIMMCEFLEKRQSSHKLINLSIRMLRCGI